MRAIKELPTRTSSVSSFWLMFLLPLIPRRRPTWRPGQRSGRWRTRGGRVVGLTGRAGGAWTSPERAAAGPTCKARCESGTSGAGCSTHSGGVRSPPGVVGERGWEEVGELSTPDSAPPLPGQLLRTRPSRAPHPRLHRGRQASPPPGLQGVGRFAAR